MAFVADFNEEELQRALAAQGGAPAVASGPGAAPATGGGPAGPNIPQAATPGAAPGGDPQGTGFVNLSRYFDANSAGAEKQASALMDPLKKDIDAAGEAGRLSVAKPADLAPKVYTPTNGGLEGDQAIQDSITDSVYAQESSDHQRAMDKWLADSTAADTEARNKAAEEQRATASGIANDPTKRNEAMSRDGQNPSAFDSYLTGAAMPGAYAGLQNYYSPGSNGVPEIPIAIMGLPPSAAARPPYPTPQDTGGWKPADPYAPAAPAPSSPGVFPGYQPKPPPRVQGRQKRGGW
jgi:hypothetical protein